MSGTEPENITKRFRELFQSQRVQPSIAGDGRAGRVSRQWEVFGKVHQIRCELCPKPGFEYCPLSCSEARRKFDETDPAKVKTFV